MMITTKIIITIFIIAIMIISLTHTYNVYDSCKGVVVRGLYKAECIQ